METTAVYKMTTPCRRGHLGWRDSHRACIECHKITTAQSAKRNRVEYNAKRRARRQTDPAWGELLNQKHREWRLRNLERVRAYEKDPNVILKRRYGITEAQFNLMLETQKQKCKICKKVKHSKEKPLQVEHNHKSKRVRGLVCGSCNVLIASIENHPELIACVLQYLAEDAHQQGLLFPLCPEGAAAHGKLSV